MSETLSGKSASNDSQQMGKRKKSAGELLIKAGTSVPLSAMEEIESLVSERDIKLSTMLRMLIFRGLAAYHRDGLLEEPAKITQESTDDQ
jgi:hypothetical protein